MNIEEEIALAIHTCISNPNERVNSDKAANATKAVIPIIERYYISKEELGKRIDSVKVNEMTPYHEVHNKTIDLVKEMLK